MTRPDSIPISQNGPSTEVTDKKPAPVVGKNQPHDDKKKQVPAVDKPVPALDKTPSPAVEKTPVPSLNGSISTEDLDSKTSKPKSPAQQDQKIIPHSKSEKDVPLMMNGDAGGSSPESMPSEALPQRKPRENRNRKKAEDKVKESPVINGIVNGEAEPAVMVNGESNGH